MHAKHPIALDLNIVIKRVPCDGFASGFCWLIPGYPLYGKHYRTKGNAKDAVSRVLAGSRARKRELNGAE
jgi:hypothetical protein